VNRQLCAARTSATQVWVAAAHIRRRSGLHELRSVGDGVGARHQAVSHCVAVAEDVNAKSGNSGLLKFGWLKTLKKSLRSSIDTVLVRCEVLVSEKSKLV
jgi:hypothetical protein